MRSTEGKPLKSDLAEWQFNQYAAYSCLPTDYELAHDQPCPEVRNAVFSQAFPTPLENPRLVCVSEDALLNLELHSDVANQGDFVEFVAGRRLPRGGRPVAHRYGGHQFGVWMGQLGDGRTHILGEYLNRRGETWQLQLKGSGPTPYSREFDGRALLRSSVREMVASEACHFLGIPTTRAAALVAGGMCVMRERRWRERAGVLLRLAPGWYRVGSLELLARAGEIAVLRRLCDFIVKEYYPDILVSDENRYIRLFSEIAERTLDLVAKWQALGFTHGLLNTDNVSLLGLTLDYGPFGFVDSYDGGYVANSSDAAGRFALSKQPDVMLWNLGQLANSLKPLLNSAQHAHLAHILKTLDTYCKNKILERFLMKLGLVEERWGDEQLVEKLLDMMQRTGADFTATFRQLAEMDPSEFLSDASLERAWSLKRLSSHPSWALWVDTYRERLTKEALRNVVHFQHVSLGTEHLQDGGAALERYDNSDIKYLLEPSETVESGRHRALRNPEIRAGGAGAGVGAGAGAGGWEVERRRRMCRANPAYVPRNWMLHEAAVDAEKDDFKKVRFLLQVFKNPYEIQPEAEQRGFSSQPPQWAYALKISCAS